VDEQSRVPRTRVRPSLPLYLAPLGLAAGCVFLDWKSLSLSLSLLEVLVQSRNPRMASSSSAVPNSDAIKPEVFDGTGFKR
jgi:hypothetical protein